MSDVVVFKDDNLELKVDVDGDTIWLTQLDLVRLFDKDQSVISRHINNIFKDKEVDEKSNMQKMHIANSDKTTANQRSMTMLWHRWRCW